MTRVRPALRRRLGSLRLRLTLWYMSVLTLILVVFSLLVYHAVRLSRLHELDLGLIAAADVIEGRWEEGQGFPILELPGPDELPLREPVRVRVETPQGEILVEAPQSRARGTGRGGDWELPPLPEHARREALRGRDVLEYVREGERTFRVLARAVWRPARRRASGEPGILQVGTSLERVERDLGHLRFWLLLIVPVTLGLTGVGGVFLADRLLKPLARMIEAAQEISSRRLDRRLPVYNPHDELGQLALTLNELFDRLEAAFANQRRFLADASHELRTPLAAMRAELEVALRRARSPEDYEVALRSQLEEVRRLGRLAERLLLLAQSDAGELPLHFSGVRLDRLLERVLERLRPLAESKGLELWADCPALEVWADAELLEQVLFSLVENAVKYTSSGEVSVVARPEAAHGDGAVWVEVRDTGPGIPAEHLPHIFERFYRVDKARSRQLGGSGLGLAIARTLVEALGGRIEVESEPGRGSTFRLRIPRLNAQSSTR